MKHTIIEGLKKRTYSLQLLQNTIQGLDESPDAIEDGINQILPSLQAINPIQEIRIPESPKFTFNFQQKVYRGKPIQIDPTPHETGLFLLPYTEMFRITFISEFQKEIAPIKALLDKLRALETQFYCEEKAIKFKVVKPTEEEKDKKSKEEESKEPPKTNRFLMDYRFFKYLYTNVPDNTVLGNMFLEIGNQITMHKIEAGNITDHLCNENTQSQLGAKLRDTINQFLQVMPLCDNMFVSSIASWASLTTFISIRAKTLEKNLLKRDEINAFQTDSRLFEVFINRLSEPFSGSPTSMQKKALFYTYQSMKAFLSKKHHPKDYFKLNNFSQVGAGKTYTTPIFIKMFAELIQEKQIKKGKTPAKFVTLFLTEASLCENVVKSMIDMGVSESSLYNQKLKDLSSLKLKSGDCVVLSRHEFGLKTKEAITQPLEVLIRKGFRFMLVSDESSFLKNTESGISSAMETLLGFLKKKKALYLDYRLTATPANNDTGDFLYLIDTNVINIGSFLHHYPKVSQEMNREIQSFSYVCKNEITLEQLLKLLNVSHSRTGVLIHAETFEAQEEKSLSKQKYELIYTDCAGAILTLYYQAIYRMKKYPIGSWLGTNKDGQTIIPGRVDIMQKLGISYTRVIQPIREVVQPFIGLEKPLVHAGSRDLDALIPCLPLLKEMSSSFTYDRALNAEDDVHFQINSKQLKPNLLESVTNLEVLEKIRQFLNLTMFVNLIRKVHSSSHAWYAVKKSVEKECALLRLDFLSTYAHLHSITLTQKEEVTTRKVHKGFQIVEETEHHPYWAASADQKEEMIALLENMAEGKILGHRLIEELAQFFAPVRYFELLTLLDAQDKDGTKNRKTDEAISKKRTLILETLSVALNFDSENKSCKQILDIFKEDIRRIQQEEDGLSHFRPSILSKYPIFLDKTLDTLEALATRLVSNERLSEVLHEIGSRNVDLAQTLAEYGIIFKASESLNFPLVLRFADRILHRLYTLLAKEGITLKIEVGDVDRIRKVIAKCASFETFAQKMAELTQSHEVPLLISCRYRFSQQSVVSTSEAKYSVTGETKKNERYTILGAFDQLSDKMGRTLVATTKSILKGFNLFFVQYGFMSEGMDNAEVRLQMAGRLRPLFPQHFKMIQSMEKTLLQTNPDSSVIDHLSRLKENIKIFDVVSPQMISGFPDIQNGKAFMLNTLLFSQIHQRSFPELFPDEEVFHFIDTKPIFNAATVEGFCKEAIEARMPQYVTQLGGIQELKVSSLSTLLEQEIQEVAEENMKLSSYYDFLSQ